MAFCAKFRGRITSNLQLEKNYLFFSTKKKVPGATSHINNLTDSLEAEEGLRETQGREFDSQKSECAWLDFSSSTH